MINQGAQPLSQDTKEFIKKCKCNSSKLICMMIGKKVAAEVDPDINPAFSLSSLVIPSL